jgi:hypothetical protein
MDANYNLAHLADIFSKTKSHSDDFPGKYYGYSSKLMADFAASMDFDRRNIATGGVDLAIFPWEMFEQTNERSFRTYTISQIFQDLIYGLKNPSTVLLCGPDYSSTRVVQCCESNIKTTLLNGISLNTFEKCFKTINSRFAKLEYDVISMQEIFAGSSRKFDLIELWVNQIDMPLSQIELFINLLSDDGVILINGTSDWAFLYENDMYGHPMHDLHEQLKSNGSVFVHHIPLHYGFTIVTKQ